jgi:putative transposase
MIHHSDRGYQYCSPRYTKILEQNQIQISMTEENHVYENAVAERVNGILKTEFLLGERLQFFEHAERLAAQSIKIYNEERLHLSLNYQTPAQCYAA